jgi:hypothetical protein
MVCGHYFEIGATVSLLTGIQLAADSIMQLIWCGCKRPGARVASPAVQGIVATREMAVTFGYTVFCACSESCASLKR